MSQESAIQACEIHYGKPIKEIILDLYAEHRDLGKVAELLKISKPTFIEVRKSVGVTDVDLHLAILRSNDPAPETVSAG